MSSRQIQNWHHWKGNKHGQGCASLHEEAAAIPCRKELASPHQLGAPTIPLVLFYVESGSGLHFRYAEYRFA